MRPRYTHTRWPLAQLISAFALIFALSLGGLVAGAPSVASAKKSVADEKVITVRYSYEKQTADQSYVLIPVVARISPQAHQDFKERHKILYKLMKSDKKSNYGNAKFSAKDDVVYLFLDPQKSTNDRFIMAEAIYTFTANGARAVRFPNSKYDGRDFTRADVNLPAYRLILPYWRGLPPHKASDSLFSLGGGVVLNLASLQERLERQDKELIVELIKTLKSGETKAVRAIIAANTIKMIPGIEDGLYALLESANTELRLAGLTGLKGRESKAVYQALRKVMDEDPEDQVKDAAAELLAQVKDQKVSIAAVFHTLRSPKAEVAIAAARKLSELKKNREADTELIKGLSRAESSVRGEMIKALIKRKAISLLIDQLKAQSQLKLEWKVEIAKAIMNDKRASKPAISFLVTQPNGEAAAEAIRSLKGKKLKGDVSSWLEQGLRHSDASARIAAAQTLAASEDKKALKILATGDVADAESGEAVHDAMRAIYFAQSDKVILGDAARQTNISLKSAATGVLGQLHNKTRKSANKKRALKAIGQLAQSPKELVRAEAARSMGDLASPEGMELLLKLKDDRSLKVKRAVSRAAVSFPEEAMRATLMGYLKESDARLLQYTLDSLATLKSSAALTEISNKTFLQHDDVKTRRAAMHAVATLIALVPMEQRAPVAGKLYTQLNTEKDAQTKILIARALAYVPSDESRDLLATELQDKNTDLVRALVDALIAHQVPASIASLEGAMDHSDATVRAYAYQESAKLKQEGLRAAVKKLFTRRIQLESDAKLKATLEAYFK